MEVKVFKCLQGFLFTIEEEKQNNMLRLFVSVSEKNSLQERSSLVGHFRELPIWSFRPHLDQVPPTGEMPLAEKLYLKGQWL